jgi:acetyl esterase/lipase
MIGWHGRVITFWVLSALAVSAHAQAASDSLSIPRDDYFTLDKATVKVRKTYPDAQPVNANCTPGVLCRFNIPYVSYGNRVMHLDLFAPLSDVGTMRPCVIFIHGGGWRSGDRSMDWPMAQSIADEGCVTATVEHRLSPEAKFPAAVHDIKAAIRWVRAHAMECRVDTNRITLVGCSSGGQLAALVGMTGDLAKLEGDGGAAGHSTRVHAVVNVDGYSDFRLSDATRADSAGATPSSEARWLGGSFRQNPMRWEEASPIIYVSRNSPPVLFLNSSLPRYRAGREEMVAALRSNGILAEVVEIPDSPHTFWLFAPWFTKAKEEIVAFLQKVGLLTRTLKE